MLNISKNLLGDESLMIIADKAECAENMKLQIIEINSSRIADAGISKNFNKTRALNNLKLLKHF